MEKLNLSTDWNFSEWGIDSPKKLARLAATIRIPSGVNRTKLDLEFVSNSTAAERRIGWLHSRNGFAV